MKPGTRAAYEARLLRVLLYIQGHLDRPLGLGELAEVAAFSPFHFARIFRAMTGETVGEHLRRLKLERAAGQLRRTRRSVTTIALDAGFDTPEAFSRSFRARFGESPSRFRLAGGVFRPPSAPSGVHYDQDAALRGFNPTQGGPPMPLDIAVKELPARPFAFLRHVGPYMEVGPVFRQALAIAAERGLMRPGTEVVMLSHDDPRVTEEGRLRADAGITLDDPAADAGPLAKGRIAGGLYAVTLYRGPYTGLHLAFDRLYGAWLPASGYEADDRPCVEVYLNDPETTAPEELLTELRLPVRRA